MGPYIADKRDGVTRDVGGYISVVRRYLLAVEGVAHELGNLGSIHVEDDLDLIFDITDSGDRADGRCGCLRLPAIVDEAAQRDVAVLGDCLDPFRYRRAGSERIVRSGGRMASSR
jgi:hypothetical protein